MTVQPVEIKAQGEYHQCFQIPEGSVKRKQRHYLFNFFPEDEHNLECNKILLNNRRHLFTLRVTEHASGRTCEHKERRAHAGADILIVLVSPWEIGFFEPMGDTH